MRRSILYVAASLALVLLLPGCADAGRKAVEEATGVKVEEDGEKVTFTNDEGESVEVSASEGGELPDGFPEDFPVYEGEVSNSSTVEVAEGSVMSAMLSTSDSFDDVTAWYKSEIPDSGWKQTGLVESDADGEKTVSIALTKGEKGTATVFITRAADSDLTEVTLSVTVTP